MTWADGFVLLLGGGGACLAGVYIAACVVPRLGGAGERERAREGGERPQERDLAGRGPGRAAEHVGPVAPAGALAGDDGLAPGWGRALRRLDAVRLERERDLRGGFAAGHGQMIGAGECSRQSAGGGK
jgi:hypothetical protein